LFEGGGGGGSCGRVWPLERESGGGGPYEDLSCGGVLN